LSDKLAHQSHVRDSLNAVEIKNSEIALWESYVNSSVINSPVDMDVAVCILNEDGSFSSISSDISNIYEKKGFKSNVGLLRSPFFGTSGFQQLSQGNSEIISNLKLKRNTDYLVIGKIRYETIKNTSFLVCRATLEVNIISVSQGYLLKNVSYYESGNGVSENQAMENATERLLITYYINYSTI